MSEGSVKENDLYIFEGMEGFEDFNPSDDSTLVALLDDLQEETLLTLLDDNLLTENDPLERININDFPFRMTEEDSLGIETDSLQPEYYSENHSSPLASDNLLEKSKRSRKDIATSQDCLIKRARLDNSADHCSEPISNYNCALAYVMHDHCYTSTSGQSSRHSNANSDEEQERSNEEGSGSDTGYDTMSASTSPASSNKQLKSSNDLSSTRVSSSSLPPVCLPLASNVDPVALIDARIKHYMCSREVNLTEEEKETLKAEGLPIPTTLPLTKVEEKALKNVRRKIRNKVAAQESRKRKKELMQTLEERVSDYSDENIHLKKRVDALEIENRSLVEQVKKLQGLISSKSEATPGRNKVGTCIMVIIFCFAVYYGGQSPSQKHADYTTASVRSRSLLSVNHKLDFHSKACDWFKQIFMREQLDDYDTSSYNNRVMTSQQIHSESSYSNHTPCIEIVRLNITDDSETQ